jgi:pectinesterase
MQNHNLIIGVHSADSEECVRGVTRSTIHCISILYNNQYHRDTGSSALSTQARAGSAPMLSIVVGVVVALLLAGPAATSSGDCPCPAWCNASLTGRQPMPGSTISVSTVPGLANCSTISGALDLARQGYRDRYTITIAPGVYEEKLVISANRPPITLAGLSAGETDSVVVKWRDCDGCSTPSDPTGEWFDQTLYVGAADFRAYNITFAGARHNGSRNMALQIAADRAFFSGCRFIGFGADTLYAGGADHRSYFERCWINGTDDFLWGIGSAVFSETTIVGTSYHTAHKGTQVDRNGILGGCTGDALLGHSCTAFLLIDCRLQRPTGFKGAASLGRPWRWMATVFYKGCWMDDHIPTAGWSVKPGTTKSQAVNLTFAEFNSSGPGARPNRPFPAQVVSEEVAATWTPERVLKGWNPLTASQQPYCWDSGPNAFCGSHGDDKQ